MIDDAIRAVVAETVAAAEVRIIAAVVAEIRAARPPRRGTVAEAATEKHVSQCTIRRWIADGTLSAHKVGGRILVDLDSAEPKNNDEIAALVREGRR